MKHFFLLILLLFLTSCYSTKNIVKDDSKEVVKTETQSPKQQNENPEFTPPKEANKTSEENTENISLPPDPPKEIKDLSSKEKFNHSRWNAILQEYVTEKGQVNYKAIKNNPGELHVYIDALSENLPNDDWPKADKLAYWINAYNALTVDLIIRNYPTNSIKDIKDPWKQRLWQLGKKWYNLDEIEHQIIRKMGEPRIHFALVCAAISCPKLYNKAFTAQHLESDLSKLTREFLADNSKNTISESELKLSKIFSWFAKDFKQEGSLIDFLNLYTEVEISDKAKKRFNNYNWDLNE